MQCLLHLSIQTPCIIWLRLDGRTRSSSSVLLLLWLNDYLWSEQEEKDQSTASGKAEECCHLRRWKPNHWRIKVEEKLWRGLYDLPFYCVLGLPQPVTHYHHTKRFDLRLHQEEEVSCLMRLLEVIVVFHSILFGRTHSCVNSSTLYLLDINRAVDDTFFHEDDVIDEEGSFMLHVHVAASSVFLLLPKQ